MAIGLSKKVELGRLGLAGQSCLFLAYQQMRQGVWTGWDWPEAKKNRGGQTGRDQLVLVENKSGGESWDWLGTTYGHAIDWMAGLGLLSIKQGGGRDG
ncbi:hypothetical protein BY996DRAFT_6582383 [Phakopsora pachyrhizi]|nr:hypothetical protein BY996DRAFT_6582383 [Phakopsora pachyrhizi]